MRVMTFLRRMWPWVVALVAVTLGTLILIALTNRGPVRPFGLAVVGLATLAWAIVSARGVWRKPLIAVGGIWVVLGLGLLMTSGTHVGSVTGHPVVAPPQSNGS